MSDTLSFYAHWVMWWAWQELKQLYSDLPGPWPVKVAIVAICFAIPGPQDEILLIVMMRVLRAWRKHRLANVQRAHI